MNALEQYGPLPKDADPLKRKCRLLQSWYRVEVLGQTECGPWRRGARAVGSMLVDGERTGSNFLSPVAFAYAKEKVDEKATNPDLTLDEYRLFNNMLSSMPMCFNLFADFRAGVQAGDPAATRALAAMFAESPIAAIESVEVEMIPRPPGDYIDDKTAFDAAILFSDGDGRACLASIETKYTDKLAGNIASRQSRKFALAEEIGLFTHEGLKYYTAHGFNQVARNLLLTFAYARKHDLQHACNYVLAPAEDNEGPRAVGLIRQYLAPAYSDRIILLPLESAVDRALQVIDGALADHLRRFRKRYLDFDQIAHLITSVQGA